MRTHQGIEARSLALHRLVAEKIRLEPALFERAKATLARWRSTVCANSQPYLVEWERLMDQGIEACLAVVVEDSERAAALRQSSPFTGILTDQERHAFLTAWRQRHCRDAVECIALAAFEGELTSRSQAKHVVARFENFEEVELDFGNVDHIGQAFADELVRVWPFAHPSTRVKITNAGEAVTKMLRHVWRRSDLPQPANVVMKKRPPPLLDFTDALKHVGAVDVRDQIGQFIERTRDIPVRHGETLARYTRYAGDEVFSCFGARKWGYRSGR